MKHYQYLIIGGGLTCDAAVSGIRELDSLGSIGMISMEPDPPYVRPNLSKGLWKGLPVEKIWRSTQEIAVSLHLKREAVELDPKKKSIYDIWNVWDSLPAARAMLTDPSPFEQTEQTRQLLQERKGE